MSDLLNVAAPLVGVLIGHWLVGIRPVPFLPMPTMASFEMPSEAELTKEVA